MGLGDVYDYYAYYSDDGRTYAIKMTQAVALAGGFTDLINPIGNPVWPFHGKNMRHVYGKTTDNHRTHVPCQQNTTTIYTSGGTFSLHGRTYTVEGAIGEKRKLNSIA